MQSSEPYIVVVSLLAHIEIDIIIGLFLLQQKGSRKLYYIILLTV